MDGESEVPEWITDMDKEILEVLGSRLILTPSIIAENIGRSRKGVSNRINSLQAGELVKKVERGKYRITNDGLDVLESANIDQKRYRRYQVAERKMVQNSLGVSKDEYLDRVKEEVQKIKREEEPYENPYQEAFDRVEKRLKDDSGDYDEG